MYSVKSKLNVLNEKFVEREKKESDKISSLISERNNRPTISMIIEVTEEKPDVEYIKDTTIYVNCLFYWLSRHSRVLVFFVVIKVNLFDEIRNCLVSAG